MAKQYWINLPVKDLARSKEFFSRLGFALNTKYESPEFTAVSVEERSMVVMLFERSAFERVARGSGWDPGRGAEVLISFDANSREEVDRIAKRAAEAGGAVFSQPAEIMGWMYGCAFTDPDGHRWNALFRDENKRETR